MSDTLLQQMIDMAALEHEVLEHWQATHEVEDHSIVLAELYGWRQPPRINRREMGIRGQLREIYTCEWGYVGVYVDA
jgi:hypothetical protein